MHGLEKRIVYIIRSDVDPDNHSNSVPSKLNGEGATRATQVQLGAVCRPQDDSFAGFQYHSVRKRTDLSPVRP